MESLAEKIKVFLANANSNSNGDGSGCGEVNDNGDGYGFGSGSCYSYFFAPGSGYGDGDGCGNGDGDGCVGGYGGDGDDGTDDDGTGMKEWNGRKVYYIDDTPTLIDSVVGNYAKGYIIKTDLNLTPCYIAKFEDCFAHGETLHKAFSDAMGKVFENLPIEERIEKFVAKHPDKNMVVDNTELFDWHNRLTGSCEMGRRTFADEHGIDVDNGSMTIAQFIALTENDYGSEIIRRLKERYN